MPKEIHFLKYGDSMNLGDEIQSLAAMKLLKSIGVQVGNGIDRGLFQSDKQVKLLINGYFSQTHIDRLLSSRNIQPIFSNIHLSWPDTDKLVSTMSKMKKYQPIGCRDRDMLKIAQDHNVSSFFNYCLTLTLDKRKTAPIRGKVFVVDLEKLFPLPEEITKRKNIEYISHEVSESDMSNCRHKFAMAQELLDMYRDRAELVITSRLHCALPCIAMGIPVILFHNANSPRMQLASEFININCLPLPDRVYAGYREKFLNRTIKGHHVHAIHSDSLIRRIFDWMHSVDKEEISNIKFNRRLAKKARVYYSQRSKYYREEIDWHPQPLDIEEIKSGIVSKFAKQIRDSL